MRLSVITMLAVTVAFAISFTYLGYPWCGLFSAFVSGVFFSILVDEAEEILKSEDEKAAEEPSEP